MERQQAIFYHLAIWTPKPLLLCQTRLFSEHNQCDIIVHFIRSFAQLYRSEIITE